MIRRAGLVVQMGMLGFLALGLGACGKPASGSVTMVAASRAPTVATSVSYERCLPSSGQPVATGPVPTAPTLMTEVPSALPPNGVSIHYHDFVEATLRPLANPKVRLTCEQAIAIARHYDDNTFPVTALLVSFTDPNTIWTPEFPASDKSALATIQNVPAWVVTFTSPKPVNVAVGGYFAHWTPPVVLVTHDSLVINAQTGAFVRGFFTP